MSAPTPDTPRTVIVALGSDHAGFPLKQALVAALRARADVEVLDLGPSSDARCDYPDFGASVARAVVEGRAERGVLVCGSGIGISIAANKIPGARAALVHDDLTARLSRAHNDAQIVCFGARVIGEATALSALDAFLTTPFEGGRHADRVAKLQALEPGAR